MKNSLPQEFASLISRSNFKKLPSWEGKTDKTEFVFELGEKIYLGISYFGKALPAPVATKQFHEGLWDFDLVEAFLSLKDNSYIELNLSINGAWWAASFSNYREKETKSPEIKLDQVYTESIDDKNIVIACFSYQNLSFNNKFNVSAIINKKYYSLNPTAKDTKPDFHLKELRC